MSSNQKYLTIKTTSNTNALLNSVSNNNTQTFINPVRTDASYNSVLSYNSTTKEITKGGYITNPIRSLDNGETFYVGSGSYINSTAITNPKINCGIASGTGDNASYASFNTAINSWYGTGFVDTCNKACNLVINHRNGNLNTTGQLYSTGAISTPNDMYCNVSRCNALQVYNSSTGVLETLNGNSLRITTSSVMYFNIGSNTNWVAYIDGGSMTVKGFNNVSDDRLKTNETFITDATTTINKLRPQIYHKYGDFDCSGNYAVESGLVAQEIYYDAPELRHLVKVPADATFDTSGNITSSIDPTTDPAGYSQWGSTPTSVSYIQLIPYLIKSIQELNARIAVLEAV